MSSKRPKVARKKGSKQKVARKKGSKSKKPKVARKRKSSKRSKKKIKQSGGGWMCTTMSGENMYIEKNKSNVGCGRVDIGDKDKVISLLVNTKKMFLNTPDTDWSEYTAKKIQGAKQVLETRINTAETNLNVLYSSENIDNDKLLAAKEKLLEIIDEDNKMFFSPLLQRVNLSYIISVRERGQPTKTVEKKEPAKDFFYQFYKTDENSDDVITYVKGLIKAYYDDILEAQSQAQSQALAKALAKAQPLAQFQSNENLKHVKGTITSILANTNILLNTFKKPNKSIVPIIKNIKDKLHETNEYFKVMDNRIKQGTKKEFKNIK